MTSEDKKKHSFDKKNLICSSRKKKKYYFCLESGLMPSKSKWKSG